MTNARDPFVAEVVRIIREKCPFQYGKKTLVLVSEQFYDAAREESFNIEKEVFGNAVTKVKHLLVCGVSCVPVPWLSGYEFEIRKA